MSMVPGQLPGKLAARPRRDWSARARSSAMDALRYTRFVAWMRRGLSLGAFAIIFAVLAFFFVERQPRQAAVSYEKLGHVDNDLTMVKPRLTGADDKGNPFVITADAAVQDAKNTKRAKLKNIEADVAMDKQSWVNARAKAGSVDMAAGRLDMFGGIDLYTDTGYQLHTESAFIDLHQNVAHGHSKVTGQGPLGALEADAFHADRDTSRIELSGHVHMTLMRTRT